jgi:hypothetical protein
VREVFLSFFPKGLLLLLPFGFAPTFYLRKNRGVFWERETRRNKFGRAEKLSPFSPLSPKRNI